MAKWVECSPCIRSDADGQAGANGASSLFWTEKEANDFLEMPSRRKRSLYRECYIEGCSFHEVDEVLSYEASREYLFRHACNNWPCSTGYTCGKASVGTPGSGAHWRVCNGRASPPLAGPRRHSAEIRWEGGTSKQVVDP
ncbi:hypothetical protein Bbelb_122480 [Branchiostoma belcheri]|nr:hypothetical protein Bbelb_122480 [Branchiostoma belcheri]